jgi:hypothetical protein
MTPAQDYNEACANLARAVIRVSLLAVTLCQKSRSRKRNKLVYNRVGKNKRRRGREKDEKNGNEVIEM